MRASVTIFLCFLAGAAAAQTEQATASLIAAIESAGCVVTKDNGDAVLAASGLDEEQVYDAVQALYQQGLAVLEPDGSMTLKTEACK